MGSVVKLSLARDGGRTRQTVIPRPMNGGANTLQLEAVLFRVQPSLPTLAKTIVDDPPFAQVVLAPQSCHEHWRLTCHAAIALVVNGKQADWCSDMDSLAGYGASQRLTRKL